MTTEAREIEELQSKVKSILDKVNPYIEFCANHGLLWPESENLLDQLMQLIASQREEAAESIEHRALKWLLSGDTGISSETLCAHMLGIERKGGFRNSPPSDVSDRGRCIRLLQHISDWLDRLDEMAELTRQTSFIIDSNGLRQEYNSWRKQIPLIRQEMEAQLRQKGGKR